MINQANTIFKSLRMATKMHKTDINSITEKAFDGNYDLIGDGKFIVLKISKQIYMVKPGKEHRVS